ncbi:OmpA family protein [Halocynthiibacter sp. C4]|uniref:OmpA family protein n=1 Tax=Halocynthiibacter sp. C4 TaxID=2992758 RepID=UPI00237BB3DA|nr:OmpA family protein [Halocynthiibacter sp. C4]MDE0588390.1 OmpA family protein [Halocynthiibacter sp. C4]
MKSAKHIVAGVLACLPMASTAMDLKLPNGAQLVAEALENSSSYRLPTGGWTGEDVASVSAEGRVEKQAWKISSSRVTTLGLLDMMRDQLVENGYTRLYECETAACGGFDFRFSVDIFPEPIMHVDLGDFRYFAAQKETEDGPQYASLVVSKSASAGYVQIVQAGGDPSLGLPLTTATKGARPTETIAKGSLSESLENKGHFVLDDLVFATGSSALAEGDFATLAALADYLKANPERNVALVGHTDSEGSLTDNIALSKKRARSVATLLVNKYDVPEAQLSAEGMGFLAPRASNLTNEGRAQNRRVEVIMTSTNG